MYWSCFLFEISEFLSLDAENQEFIITEGVFNKTKTAIQLRKIQQVNQSII
jgi:uncharacterized membrane protein YdbT with pleckstrin-like domain